jgi:membrane protease subunit HflC
VRIKRADLPTRRIQRRCSVACKPNGNGAPPISRTRVAAGQRSRRADLVANHHRPGSATVEQSGEGRRERTASSPRPMAPTRVLRLYRSMQAYQNSFDNGRTRALISPKSDFFRYFSRPTPARDAPRRQEVNAIGQGGLICAIQRGDRAGDRSAADDPLRRLSAHAQGNPRPRSHV